MQILYDLIFLVIAALSLPVYLVKRKFHPGFFLRFGILPKNLKLKEPVWIHAVSVGEIMAVRGLIEGLRVTYPNKQLVISTVTPTGNKIAREIARPGDLVTYLPLDFSFIVGEVLGKIKPCLFILAETEIWPNLITGLYKRKIPIVTVNGRISDASFAGYYRIKFLLKPILNRIKLFCVQSSRDAYRLATLGVSADKIKITGNLKFDTAPRKLESAALSGYREKLDLKPEDEFLVCGSTHPAEEEMILGAYQELLGEFPNLKLLIAPRHPERSKDIAKLLGKKGFRSVFISEAASACSGCLTKAVFILDLMGELNSFYALADIVFVGGSLIKKGGHNILEPASLEKPLLFGPYMSNFRDIADLFLLHQAAVLVNSPEELKDKIKELLADTGKAEDLAVRAKDLILKNTGATQRTLELIKDNF